MGEQWLQALQVLSLLEHSLVKGGVTLMRREGGGGREV